MFLAHFAVDAARVAVLLGFALAAMPLLRRAASATRRLVLALALGGALVLPLISALAPAWRLQAPASIGSLRGKPVAEPLAEGKPAPVAAPRGGAASMGASVRAVPSFRLDATDALTAVWALGALLVAARLAVGLARSRAMVRRASAAPSWSAAVARAERSTGLRAQVRVTCERSTPAVTGVVAPVVLVPRSSEAWTDERRYAVLLHELAHVRQRDCLAQIVAQLACAVHWFDPLAWLALRRLRLEREIAADDAVIFLGARASGYAEDLLAIAGLIDDAREAPSAMLGMTGRSELAARVTAIVSPDRARRPLSRLRSALLVAASAAVLFAVACATPEAREPAAAPPAAPSPDAKAADVAAASTIDPRLQAIVDEELERTVAEWEAATGAIVVLDPSTGEILANAGRSHGSPDDVAVRRAYVTGSTLKTITLAAALEEGVVSPADRFDCENGARAYGDRTLRDAGAYGSLSLPEMLAVSSNIGFSKVFDRLGGEKLGRWLRRFHFGAAPALASATAGELPPRIEDRTYEGAVVAIGEAITASPLQVAAAYATLANDGVYIAPTLVRRAGSAPREQLVKPDTARAVVAMLEEAVNGERATGKKARIAGARVAGKTGTAVWTLPDGGEGTYSSFVGLVPLAHPRFVILVGIERPRRGESGGTVAAPAFARVASRALGG
jgi:beta-lactamase regulating signal transducer with metallopeptidase domain